MKLADIRAKVKQFGGWTIRQEVGYVVASKRFIDGTHVRARNESIGKLNEFIWDIECSRDWGAVPEASDE